MLLIYLNVFFLFLGHLPLDFWRKIGRDATVLKFSFSLARSAHKVFVYIPLWRKIWVCSVWVWSFYHACKVFEVIPSSFVSLNPLLCSSIFSCSSIHLLCGLLFNIAVPFIHQEGLKCLYYKKKSHLLILLSSNFFLVFVLEAIVVPGVWSGQEPQLYIKKNH